MRPVQYAAAQAAVRSVRRQSAHQSVARDTHYLGSRRRADLPHATHYVARQQREFQSHRALGGTWQTQYDFEARNFASQIVSLSRDLHDWRAIFAFTQSPNGSFAFNFLISLKAEPELKFDYHKSTYRNEGFP